MGDVAGLVEVEQQQLTAEEDDDEEEEKDVFDTLTPELLKVASAFEMVGDDKLRHKQLLYMATQLDTMDGELFIPENKVPGCLSTVYVDGTARVESDGSVVIDYVGDSD